MGVKDGLSRACSQSGWSLGRNAFGTSGRCHALRLGIGHRALGGQCVLVEGRVCPLATVSAGADGAAGIWRYLQCANHHRLRIE
jgi:hypothetical protein